MKAHEILAQARDAMTLKKVFGDPIERDGVTVIPVARIAGGAGGGSDPRGATETEANSTLPRGQGSGYGFRASPAGVYVIKGDQVKWRPAIDVNRIIMGGQIVAIVFLLTVRAIFVARSRR